MGVPVPRIFEHQNGLQVAHVRMRSKPYVRMGEQVPHGCADVVPVNRNLASLLLHQDGHDVTTVLGEPVRIPGEIKMESSRRNLREGRLDHVVGITDVCRERRIPPRTR